MSDRRRARVATPFDESHAEIPEGCRPGVWIKVTSGGYPHRCLASKQSGGLFLQERFRFPELESGCPVEIAVELAVQASALFRP
jgi:hypothetical protein